MEQIGRYRISGELGRGAMGVIYAATDPLIGRQVAIKTIHLGSLGSGGDRAELTRRLYREAQSAGILSHPGIITIHDVGEQGEDAYIVMEFVAGQSLEDLLASGVPQHSNKYLTMLMQAAVALDYAHAKGIIHRDIKPSNIMICEDGGVKVADFGVAKLTASASMTQSGLVLGTPSYMSPEQAQGKSVDGRSDQFSLAVVAYRILTGSLPFVASTLTALIAKILWEEPDYQSAGLRPPLLAVFTKALSKNPELRFASCTEFVQQLQAAFAQETQPVIQSKPADAAADKTSPAGVTAKKKKAALIATVCVGAIVLMAVAIVASRLSRRTEPPVQPQRSSAVDGIKAGLQPGSASDATIRSSPVPPAVSPEAKAAKPEKASPPPQPGVSPKLAAANTTAQPQKPAGLPAKSPPSNSGTIVWTGELQKNSILVIEDQEVSIGSVSGGLPGKPVKIEVRPKDVVVRQVPNETNAWKVIILYSGNQKHSSITIDWKLVR